ncbi:MAG: NAD(P)-dependent alcohol dehydrogenase [Gammaproteobacteria bacterium]|nr:NAD(P)-dependent alcohol dehydrogenase [Gammaproteobacteria bacterium]
MKITAAVARAAAQPFSVETLELDAPRADEVLVRIAGAGVCHTDLVARDQALPVPLPIVLGHEGAGVVEAVGAEVRELAPGDHAVLSFASCGHCHDCGRHAPGYCAEFFPRNFGGARPDGSSALAATGGRVASNFFGQSSFASHALVQARNAIKVRGDAPLDLLGPLGCGVQTGAGSIMQAFACRAGSSVLVTGGGSVGLSAVLGAVVQGCATIIVLEPNAARRDMALALGATHALDPAAGELPAQVRAILPRGVDYVLDTTGRADVILASVGAVAPLATLGIVGVPASAADATLGFDVIALLGLGLTVKGITEGDVDPARFIPRLVDLFMAGRFPFERLVTRYPLAEINRAIEDQHRGLCIKPVLVP